MNSLRFLFINHTIDLSNKALWVIRPGSPERIPLTYLDLLIDRNNENEPQINKRFGKSFDLISLSATLIVAGFDSGMNTETGGSFPINIKYSKAVSNPLFHSRGNGNNYSLVVVDQFMSLSDGLNLSAKLREYETVVSPGNHIRIFALATMVSEEQILRMWNEGISFQPFNTFRTSYTVEILKELQVF